MIVYNVDLPVITALLQRIALYVRPDMHYLMAFAFHFSTNFNNHRIMISMVLVLELQIAEQVIVNIVVHQQNSLFISYKSNYFKHL